MTSVIIGNSVTSIGEGAFDGCTGLTSVTIGNSVTSIGDHAFYRCTGLTSVTIGNSVTSIGNSAFSQCTGLTSVTIGNSVTSIGNSAFNGCIGLTSVTIPNSVTSIGYEAFHGCTGLRVVNMLNPNPPTLGSEVFPSKSIIYVPKGSLSAYKSSEKWSECNLREGSGVSVGNLLYYFNQSAKTAEVLGPKIVSIKSIDIPSTVTYNGETYSVTSIGERAFSECTGLTSITIPNSVTSIGNEAFRDCESLISVVVETGNPKYDSRDSCNAIIETSTNTLISGCKTTVIPNSVTSIGRYAFWNCKGLTEVICRSATPPRCDYYGVFSRKDNLYVPKGCVEVYKKANGWSDFKNIKEIEPSLIVDNLQYFYNTSNKTAILLGTTDPYIMDLVIPNALSVNGEIYPVIGIGANAFKDHRFLMAVVIGENVTYADEDAFTGTKIDQINVENLKNWCNMDHNASNLRLSVPGNIYVKGQSTSNLIIPDGITKINDYAFYNSQNITSVTIPNSVTSIGERAFYGCTSLTSVTIGNSIKSIYGNVFDGCPIDKVYISDLKSWCDIDFVGTVMKKPGTLYLNNQPISTLVIPEGVTKIKDKAFYNCASITGVTLPKTVTNLYGDVFEGCDNLEKVYSKNLIPAKWEGSAKYSNVTLYVPFGAARRYSVDNVWCDFKSIEETDVFPEGGVEGIEADEIKVVTKGGAIEVSGADGERVEVYSLSGQCVYSGMDTSISVEKGIYIVRVAGTVHKVIL